MPLHEYRILEKMAVGSFGMVFRVQRILDDAILVLKRIPLEDLDADQRHEAAQEMYLMTELHHPYIVAQRDAFLFNENDLCLIMDYYDGGDLEPFVLEQRERDEYFPFQHVMLWFTQMLLATDYLHAHGIVHRDLKTRNLFVDRRTNSIAVGDFGIAEKIDTSKIATWRNLNNTRSQRFSSGQLEMMTPSPPASGIRRWSSAASIPRRPSQSVIPRGQLYTEDSALSHSHLRATPDDSPVRYDRPGISSHSPLNPFYLQSPEQLNQAMRGTPLYMAPEALQGGHVGPKADVWSLGCILYELLALRHPFETRDIGGLVMRVTQGAREPLPTHYPAAVHKLMDVMLSVDPRGRPSCAEILATPLLKAYVELLQILRVPCSTPTDPTEVSLTNQLNAHGAALNPSAKHAFAAAGHPGRTDVDDQSSPRVLAYTKIEQSLAPPLNPPSIEHKLARQRQAELAAGTGTVYASLSAESSITSSAFPSGAGTFFTAGAPLITTPIVTPKYPNKSPSRLGNEPSSAGTGVGSSNPAVMAPTASMRPFMIYDNASPTSEPHQLMPNLARRSSSTTGLAISAAAAAAAAAVTSQSPLLPPSLPDRARAGARVPTSTEDADQFYAEYANVVDMRDKETAVIAAAVAALREAVQAVLRRKKQQTDGADLQKRYGSEITNSMPDTTGCAPTTATTVTATTSSAGSPSQTRVIGGTRVYYNNLYSCLLHQQHSQSGQHGPWRGGAGGVGLRPRAGLDPSTHPFHDSMPVSSSTPSIAQSVVPATSDGVLGRRQTPSNARNGRLGAVSGRPIVPLGDRPASGYLRRALFDKECTTDSLAGLLASSILQDEPPPQQTHTMDLPDLVAGPPMMTAMGLVAAAGHANNLWFPQAYAARRGELVKRIATKLESPVWQAVYWYYRDTTLIQRDPRMVLGWVPDRRRWGVLPLVDELVVLDRFLTRDSASLGTHGGGAQQMPPQRTV